MDEPDSDALKDQYNMLCKFAGRNFEKLTSSKQARPTSGFSPIRSPQAGVGPFAKIPNLLRALAHSVFASMLARWMQVFKPHTSSERLQMNLLCRRAILAMSSSIKIVECQPVKAAVVRLVIPRDEIQKEMSPAIKEVMQTLKEQKIERQGPLFAHHLSCSDKTFDFEVGFPTATDVEHTNNRVYASMTPSGKAAKTIHIGPYEKLHQAWKEFDDCMKDKGLKRQGESLWEVDTEGPETHDDPEKWVTEMYRPIE